MSATQLEHGDWELRLGDCLDPVTGLASLPDGCADHVITDPPYEAEAHTKQRRCRDVLEGRAVSAALSFDPISDLDRGVVGAHVSRLAGRWALAFCQVEAAMRWSAAFAGMRYARTMVWVKPDGAPQFTGDRPGMGYESIVVAHGGTERMRWNAGGKRGVYEFLTGKNDGHPTQKPLALMEALVRDFTDPGDLILDPFAGSGTTGVACRRLGRRFLGWERDPKFHAAAMKRIGAARQQLGLLERAKAPKVEQGDMFKPGKAVRP